MKRLKEYAGFTFFILGLGGIGGYCDLGTGLMPSLVILALGIFLMRESIIEEVEREKEDDYSRVLGLSDCQNRHPKRKSRG